jgi:hypothetical protein
LQDKINAFWEITKKELEDRKAEMRNQDRQTEEAEDMHQRELKVRPSVSNHSNRDSHSVTCILLQLMAWSGLLSLAVAGCWHSWPGQDMC